MWGLGCIIWEVYNGLLSQTNDLARIGNIPKKLSSTYMELVAANPSKRPNPREKIKNLSSGPNAFFKNDIIDVLLFLEELQIKDDQDKSRFFTRYDLQKIMSEIRCTLERGGHIQRLRSLSKL